MTLPRLGRLAAAVLGTLIAVAVVAVGIRAWVVSDIADARARDLCEALAENRRDLRDFINGTKRFALRAIPPSEARDSFEQFLNEELAERPRVTCAEDGTPTRKET